ncbi:MAG: hypothetical protein ACM3WV_10335 [Bacillota bacterium]
MIFTDLPGIPDTRFIGARDTSPIYFLQMMVRYGLIWGRIAPGDDHRMGHFLEEDLPGLIIIHKSLTDLKYLIALGLMLFGAPATVPGNFPFPYGRRVVAEDPEEIVAKGMRFSNLRVRYIGNEAIRLPEYCNTAYANKNSRRSKSWAAA